MDQKTKTKRGERFNISLSDEMRHVVREIEKHTGISPTKTIEKLMSGHAHELWAYLTHLEALPAGPSPARAQAVNLLENYGPDLIEGIREAKANPWGAA